MCSIRAKKTLVIHTASVLALYNKFIMKRKADAISPSQGQQSSLSKFFSVKTPKPEQDVDENEDIPARKRQKTKELDLYVVLQSPLMNTQNNSN